MGSIADLPVVVEAAVGVEVVDRVTQAAQTPVLMSWGRRRLQLRVRLRAHHQLEEEGHGEEEPGEVAGARLTVYRSPRRVRVRVERLEVT